MSKDKEAGDLEEYRKLRDGIPPEMVYAFHRALSDSDLGEDGFEEIRTGLTAAFAHLLSSAPAPGEAVWSLGDIEEGTWRDLDHVDHGGFAKVVWRMEDDERSPANEARALAMVAALNAAETVWKAMTAAAPAKSMTSVSQRIQELVEVHGSVKDVANYLGVNGVYLQRLANDSKTSPSEDVLKKLGLQRIVSYVRGI